jgi:hypothetical protein
MVRGAESIEQMTDDRGQMTDDREHGAKGLRRKAEALRPVRGQKERFAPMQ